MSSRFFFVLQVNQYSGKDGELVMLKALNCTQGDRYLELAEKREANESFVYGWMKERVAV
ncbi:hypothetical protein ESTG_04974 [Escherichia coli B799]|nr:hypothetical protein ESTG_04974 [Escherichia coli B799]